MPPSLLEGLSTARSPCERIAWTREPKTTTRGEPRPIFTHTTPHRCPHLDSARPMYAASRRDALHIAEAQRRSTRGKRGLGAYTTLREGRVPVLKHDAPPPLPSVRTPLRDRLTLTALSRGSTPSPVPSSLRYTFNSNPSASPPRRASNPLRPAFAFQLAQCPGCSSPAFWSCSVSCRHVHSPLRTHQAPSASHSCSRTPKHPLSLRFTLNPGLVLASHVSPPTGRTHSLTPSKERPKNTKRPYIQRSPDAIRRIHRHPHESVRFAPLSLNPHSTVHLHSLTRESYETHARRTIRKKRKKNTTRIRFPYVRCTLCKPVLITWVNASVVSIVELSRMRCPLVIIS